VRAWRLIAAAIASIDWSLVILAAGFFAVAPLGPLLRGNGAVATAPPDGISSAPAAQLVTTADPDHTAYESSIAAAAIKHPADAVELEIIGPSTTVNVVTFGPPRTPPAANRGFDMWVALASQLRTACAGAADPVRRLQQALGLPPIAAPERIVTEIVVPRDGLFRPCVAGGDITSLRCAMDFPPPLAANADPKIVRAAYDRLHFVTAQMWNSYRVGFPTRRGSPTDYPSTGFPFTGMGWTYDWSNAPNHIGISEFVVKRDALISVVGTKTPAEFCAAPGSTK
jgi:hypothetical protein